MQNAVVLTFEETRIIARHAADVRLAAARGAPEPDAPPLVADVLFRLVVMQQGGRFPVPALLGIVGTPGERRIVPVDLPSPRGDGRAARSA